MLIGRTSAAAPSTRAILQMLEPTALPIAMSPRPRYAESTPTASSGLLVPKATMVRPATNGVIPSRRPIDVAPRTRQSAPSNNNARPAIKRKNWVITRPHPVHDRLLTAFRPDRPANTIVFFFLSACRDFSTLLWRARQREYAVYRSLSAEFRTETCQHRRINLNSIP
ncbi:hypothetical protein MnTg04_00841 [bacterium MnTg04]|nr:hypothetical protein MnTg04_00841 [bacterium MnTg04]